ncbi:MAG: hypothetical protein COB23_07100 [Methylophaga sp.]|nr:MAG: hypothetical protein COB23_07100 [Methylophaga sp.]
MKLVSVKSFRNSGFLAKFLDAVASIKYTIGFERVEGQFERIDTIVNTRQLYNLDTGQNIGQVEEIGKSYDALNVNMDPIEGYSVIENTTLYSKDVDLINGAVIQFNLNLESK